MAPDRPRQLALPLSHSEQLSREDFLEGDANSAALALIDRWPDWPNRIMMLVGPEGAGKSHLAAIWAETAGARSVAAHALTTSAVPDAIVTGSLVVEDLAPSQIDERAIFHLMNIAREEKTFILMTARAPPTSFDIGLADLRSRLRMIPTVTISAPDDRLMRALLVKLCADRQMTVDEGLVSFLVTHVERSFAALRRAVQSLDAEAMRQKRPVSRMLAAELFR